MYRKLDFFKLCVALLCLAGGFSPVLAAESPREILDRSRTAGSAAEASQILEKNLAGSAGLRPYYLLELTRLAATEANWAKALDWSTRQDMAALPAPIADETVYWYGQALLHSAQTAKAADLYIKRIDGGTVRDPLLFLACLRIASAGAERLVAKFDAAFPTLKQTDPETFALSRYLGGLSAVRSGNWTFAWQSLSRFSPAYDGQFPEYAPWSHYYLAYSLYRLGRWNEAVAAFSFYLDTWKNHEYSWQAATAAAYAAIQAGSDALPFAERAVRLAPGKPELAESLLLQSSILIDKTRFTDAESLLSGVADGRTTGGLTPSAPRALFMLADVAVRQKKPELAAERWLDLVSRFPRDPLAEEAQYRCGEQWYIAGDWQGASAQFARYRQTWPSGRFLDSVLWSGGYSYNRAGNADLAILWWQALTAKYPASPASARAYRELIGALRSKSDWNAALDTAQRYRASFPAESKLDDIDMVIDELTKLRNGESADTAGLLTAYAKAGRAATADGRAAGLRLARAYLADFSKRDAAREILKEITAKAPRSAESLSVAERGVFAASWTLLGNGYRDISDYKGSSAALLAAGTLYAPIDGERSAEALYGATDSFLQAGLRADARKTVDTLTKTWPDSVWTRRAAILMAERPGE